MQLEVETYLLETLDFDGLFRKLNGGVLASWQ